MARRAGSLVQLPERAVLPGAKSAPSSACRPADFSLAWTNHCALATSRFCIVFGQPLLRWRLVTTAAFSAHFSLATIKSNQCPATNWSNLATNLSVPNNPPRGGRCNIIKNRGTDFIKQPRCLNNSTKSHSSNCAKPCRVTAAEGALEGPRHPRTIPRVLVRLRLLNTSCPLSFFAYSSCSVGVFHGLKFQFSLVSLFLVVYDLSNVCFVFSLVFDVLAHVLSLSMCCPSFFVLVLCVVPCVF